MKKDICEISGCRKTATVKLRNGHRICEDCAKKLREFKRAGTKPVGFYKELMIGDVAGWHVYADVLVKL